MLKSFNDWLRINEERENEPVQSPARPLNLAATQAPVQQIVASSEVQNVLGNETTPFLNSIQGLSPHEQVTALASKINMLDPSAGAKVDVAKNGAFSFNLRGKLFNLPNPFGRGSGQDPITISGSLKYKGDARQGVKGFTNVPKSGSVTINIPFGGKKKK